MKLTSFLRDRALYILGLLITLAFLYAVLNMFYVNTYAIVLVEVLVCAANAAAFTYDYLKRKKYYSNLMRTLDTMDKRQYISALLEPATFADAEILTDIINLVTKSMNDEIAVYGLERDEYHEYIETWIHEIKIPISCISLLCENNDLPVTRGILDETNKIEGYVEQALYYARGANLEADYVIREISLDALVKGVVKKLSKQLIAKHTELEFNNLNVTVFTDAKWVTFILGQILSNSIKYAKNALSLKFIVHEDRDKITLCIADNGCGIPSKDIKRVFDKGFTGENGRGANTKSTGMGLYICKRLCDKMHMGISAESTEGNGTTVFLSFPRLGE